jgi:hypothetical protein
MIRTVLPSVVPEGSVAVPLAASNDPWFFWRMLASDSATD